MKLLTVFGGRLQYGEANSPTPLVEHNPPVCLAVRVMHDDSVGDSYALRSINTYKQRPNKSHFHHIIDYGRIDSFILNYFIREALEKNLLEEDITNNNSKNNKNNVSKEEEGKTIITTCSAYLDERLEEGLRTTYFESFPNFEIIPYEIILLQTIPQLNQFNCIFFSFDIVIAEPFLKMEENTWKHIYKREENIYLNSSEIQAKSSEINILNTIKLNESIVLDANFDFNQIILPSIENFENNLKLNTDIANIPIAIVFYGSQKVSNEFYTKFREILNQKNYEKVEIIRIKENTEWNISQAFLDIRNDIDKNSFVDHF